MPDLTPERLDEIEAALRRAAIVEQEVEHLHDALRAICDAMQTIMPFSNQGETWADGRLAHARLCLDAARHHYLERQHQ